MRNKYLTRELVLTALMAALTTLGAWIKISLPFTPVPITFQVLFTLLSGAVLGPWLGALSQIVYILLGCAGLPVFAGGIGFGVLLGPTGGYLFGFVVAAFLVGKLVGLKKEPSYILILIFMVIGIVVIYFFGVIQLAIITKIGLKKAIIGGVIPFIWLDVTKAVIAAYLAIFIRKQLALSFSNF